MRRQLFLMFKECIHNVARHSGSTDVKAELRVVGREIELTVQDNGRGFDPLKKPPGLTGGNGIPGMRRRAGALGGSIQLITNPCQGCKVSVRLPLRRGPLGLERF
jgi:signal transduction histidine kinase